MILENYALRLFTSLIDVDVIIEKEVSKYFHINEFLEQDKTIFVLSDN